MLCSNSFFQLFEIPVWVKKWFNYYPVCKRLLPTFYEEKFIFTHIHTSIRIFFSVGMLDIEHTKQRIVGFVTNALRTIFVIGTKSVCYQQNRIEVSLTNKMHVPTAVYPY